MAIGAGELQGNLIFRVQGPAAGKVAAQQRIRAGADNHLVAGIVAAAAKHGALHGRQHFSFASTGDTVFIGFGQGGIAQFGGPAHIGELGRALHQTQAT